MSRALSRLIMTVIVLLVQAACLLLLSRWWTAIWLATPVAAFATATVVALLNLLLWPLLLRVLERLNLIVFVVLSLLLTSSSVLGASYLLAGFQVPSLGGAFLVALVLALAATIVTTIFGFLDTDYSTRRLIKRLAGRSGPVTRTDVPGFLYLEIDGLSEPVLREAIAAGRVPTMARWLASGSHQLIGWECDLPSQTSASQAGILHGTNHDFPAFRWVEKAAGRIMVSNHPKDTAELERRISDGNGLLAGGGAARGNMFSGDAAHALMTFSTILDKSRNSARDYTAYFASPVNVLRSLLLMIWDIILELSANLSAKLRKVQPHGHRGGSYPLVRAFTTVLLREITFYTLIADMYRGTPTAYVTLVGYDEVAHHSGVRAPDALAVLRRIDQQFARLEKVLPTAPRPYHFVVLSDHGQSQGATFKQRYGFTLGDLVQRLMASDQEVAELNYDAEQWGYLSAFLTETAQVGDTAVTRMTRTAVGDRTSDGTVDLGPGRAVMATATEGTALPEVTVLASGNLGLVFFNELPGRQTDADILARYPEVLPGLTQHAGVGFVMVRSTAHGPVAIGHDGIHFLAEGRVEGTDPLAHYGPLAARHLLRLDGFSNAPDILVNSMYDTTTDEVCAFEELIGCHGGLGGLQMHPFLLAPAVLPLPAEPIVGAAAIYHLLKRWQAPATSSATPAPATPVASP